MGCKKRGVHLVYYGRILKKNHLPLKNDGECVLLSIAANHSIVLLFISFNNTHQLQTAKNLKIGDTVIVDDLVLVDIPSYLQCIYELPEQAYRPNRLFVSSEFFAKHQRDLEANLNSQFLLELEQTIQYSPELDDVVWLEEMG